MQQKSFKVLSKSVISLAYNTILYLAQKMQKILSGYSSVKITICLAYIEMLYLAQRQLSINDFVNFDKAIVPITLTPCIVFLPPPNPLSPVPPTPLIQPPYLQRSLYVFLQPVLQWTINVMSITGYVILCMKKVPKQPNIELFEDFKMNLWLFCIGFQWRHLL